MWRKVRIQHIVLIAVNIAIVGWIVQAISKSDLFAPRKPARPHWSEQYAALHKVPQKAVEPPKSKPIQNFKPFDISLKRWAILASPDVQKLGISEELMTSLSARDRIELVDRDALVAAIRELQLSELAGAQSATERLKLGQILRADLLVVLSLERSGDYETLRITQSETKYGCRLGIDFVVWDVTNQRQILKQIESLVIDRVERFSGRIDHLIGVATFINKSLTQESDRFQNQLTATLQNGLTAHPGVAVLETDEAQAIGRESLVVSPETSNQVFPLWVAGDYAMLPSPDGRPSSMRLKMTVRNARGVAEELVYDRVELTKVTELLTGEVAKRILEISNASANAAFDPQDQAQNLAERAKALDDLGSHGAAVRLYETAVLLDPKNVELRRKTIGAICRDCSTITKPFNKNRLTVTHEKLKEVSDQITECQLRVRDHVEYLLANKLCNFNQAMGIGVGRFPSAGRLHEHVPRDLRDEFKRAAMERARAEREFVLQYYPEIYKLDTLRHNEQTWFGTLVVHLNTSGLDEEYLSALVQAIGKNLTDEMPIYSQIIRLLETYPLPSKAAFRAKGQSVGKWQVSDEKMLAFFDELQKLPQQSAKYYGRYGQFYWDWMHCNQGDSEQVRSMLARLDGFLNELKANPPSKGLKRPVEADPHYEHLLMMRTTMQTMLDGRTPGTRRSLSVLPEFKTSIRNSIAKRRVSPKKLPQIEYKVLDVNVQLSAGDRTPFKKVAWQVASTRSRSSVQMGFHRLLACNGKFDLFWGPASIFVMREPGLLSPVFADPGVLITEVKWDGEHLWVATIQRGIMVLDLDGKVLTSFGPSEGLPPHDQGVCVQPIGNRKAIAAGSFGDKRRGWCAILERGDKPKVQVFHEATKLRFARGPGYNHRVDEVFRPKMMFDYAGKGSPRQILIARQGGDWELLPWLAIDVETLQVSTLDLDSFIDEWQPAAGLLQLEEGMLAAEPRGLQKVVLPGSKDKLWTHSCLPYLFDHKGQIVVPGMSWARLDRTTLEFVPGGLFPQRQFQFYGLSAHYGIVGWNLGEELVQIDVPTEPFEMQESAPSPKPTVEIECPNTFVMPEVEVRMLVALSEKTLHEPPPEVPHNALKIYSETDLAFDRWMICNFQKLWIDPPIDKPPRFVSYYVDGRLARIDDARRDVPVAWVYFNESGAPRMAIHDYREPLIKKFKNEAPHVNFFHLDYDSRGYLSRITWLAKKDDGPIKLKEVFLHRYLDSYNDGYEAHYSAQGKLWRYTRFLPEGEGRLTREWDICQLVRFGLKPIYPLPEGHKTDAKGVGLEQSKYSNP
jgi:hypothetical protein